MNPTCTSGRKIPEIGIHADKPCGRALIVTNDPKTGNQVLLCPRCDRGAT